MDQAGLCGSKGIRYMGKGRGQCEQEKTVEYGTQKIPLLLGFWDLIH